MALLRSTVAPIRLCTAALLVGVVAAGVQACAVTAIPKVDDTVPAEAFTDHGAVIDASRAYPIAFYADPSAEPAFAEAATGMQTLRIPGPQWLAHLALKLNESVARVGLYDLRFSLHARDVFATEAEAGRVRYTYRAQKDDPARFHPARVAVLTIQSIEGKSVSDGVELTLSVQVDMVGFTHVYVHREVVGTSPRDVFIGLGKKLVSDPAFWRAVAAAP